MEMDNSSMEVDQLELHHSGRRSAKRASHMAATLRQKAVPARRPRTYYSDAARHHAGVADHLSMVVTPMLQKAWFRRDNGYGQTILMTMRTDADPRRSCAIIGMAISRSVAHISFWRIQRTTRSTTLPRKSGIASSIREPIRPSSFEVTVGPSMATSLSSWTKYVPRVSTTLACSPTKQRAAHPLPPPSGN